MEPGHVAYSVAHLDTPGGKWRLVREFGLATPHLDKLFHFTPMKAGITKNRYAIMRHCRNGVDLALSEIIFEWNPTLRVWLPKDKHISNRLDLHPAAVKDRLLRAGLITKEV